MRSFLTIWLGQVISTISSRTSILALIVWVWETTESATPLALGSFFVMFPGIITSLVAGVAVDRFNRKLLMALGDGVGGLSSIVLMLIYLSGHLQVWHLYVVFAMVSPFTRLQILASETAIAMLVPEQFYSRAAGLRAMLGYGSQIVAPALAGALYPTIGLVGILSIDVATFVVAIAILACVRFPPAGRSAASKLNSRAWWRDLTFGWHYLRSRPSLALFAAVDAAFWFAHDLAGALYSPLILARSDGSAAVFGTVSSAAGVGGVTGAAIAGTRVAPKRPIRRWLLGIVAAGSAKVVFGLGRSLSVWVPAQFCSSLNFPLMASYQQSILLAKVAPELQGRVFATIALFRQLVGAIASLLAGPLADFSFEPALQAGGLLAPVLGGIFGTGTGAGIALLYVLAATGMVLVGMVASTSARLNAAERLARE